MSMDPIRVVPRLCLALVTTAAQAFGQADHCRDVLRGGVFDQEVARTHAQRWSSAADYFCSDAFLSWSSSSDTRAGLSILIDGVPLGFSGQSLNQQSMQQREAFCRQSTRALSASDETSLFRAVANPAIVNAWAQCMDVNRPFNLIVLSWRPVGSDGISVQARFTPPGVMDAPVILQVAMLNLATQQSGLVPGRAITPGAGVGGTFMRTAPDGGRGAQAHYYAG